MGYAQGCCFGIYPADIFIDEFGFIAGGLYASWLMDECWHSAADNVAERRANDWVELGFGRERADFFRV